MFHSTELSDELQALRNDVARLLGTTAEGLFEASGNRADALADEIKAVLHELGETLNEQQGHVEKVIAERPVISLAAAFAGGLVIGFMLRRH